MDVQMPVMDGYEATRLIRAHPRLAGTLVIAMTANAGREDQARCIAAGMDEFVTKPIAPNLLFTVLSRWMNQRADEAARPDRIPARPAISAAAGVEVPAPEPLAVASAPVPVPAAAPIAALSAGAEMFDISALAQTFGNKQEKMRKYALMFLDSARDGMVEVNEAMAEADIVRLSELGHRIKSSARAVGAMSFADLCLSLEHLQAGADPAVARAIVVQMQPLLDLLKDHIAQELSAHAAG
jgi:CheY-like chemotaxis protein